MPTENAKNRGYYKIKGAADAFNFDFRNKVVLDIGSSTGGFTEYALDHGAKKVIAIEKGTNQMAKPLRYDPRIDLHEKTDVFKAKTIGLSSEEHPQLLRGRSDEPREDGREERSEEDNPIVYVEIPDVIVADVSFISLKKVLSHAKGHLSDEQTEFLVMLKPQFEATPAQLNRGIVKNEKIRRDIIKQFELWLKLNGFIILAKRDNELKGRNGNIERFYHLKLAK
ncbi:MAG: SAM-dependent methyltransferase [Candidatus Saccharibacteria bacterium]|nr:SAM-dependent methyltransferase [Candidatus Saccharibacteria bacterium]